VAKAGTITVDFDAKIARLQQKLKTASGSVRRTAVRMRRDLQPAMMAIQRSAAAAAVGIAAMAATGLRSADSLAKTADKLGLATEKLAGLRFAAERFSGFSARQFDLALQRMTRRIAEAAVGTGEAQQALKDLGLDAQTLARLAPDEAFRRIADAIQNVEGQGQRLRIAFKLFDSEGAGLVNTLNAGRDALDEMQARAEALGIALDREAAAKAEQANDAIAEMRASAAGMAQTLAIELAPSITGVSKALADWIADNKGFSDEISTGFKVLTQVIGVLADGVHGLRVVFKGLQVAINAFGTEVVEAFAYVNRIIINDINRIIAAYNTLAEKLGAPIVATIDMDETALDRAAGRARATRDKLIKEWKELVMQQLPSVALQNMVKAAEEAADKAATAIRDKINQATTEISDAKVELLVELKLESDDPFAQIDKRKAELGMIEGYDPADFGIDVAAKERTTDFIKAYEDLRNGIKETNEVVNDLGLTFASAFEEAIISGNDLRDVFKGLLDDIIRIIARLTVTQPLANAITGWLSGGFSFGGGATAAASGGIGGLPFGGGMATGGPVAANTAYLVGEKGPEYLFMGSMAGRIEPASGGVTIQNVINVDSRADREQLRAELGQVVAQSVEGSVARVRQLSRRGQLL
jgi:hypothetical protein